MCSVPQCAAYVMNLWIYVLLRQTISAVTAVHPMISALRRASLRQTGWRSWYSREVLYQNANHPSEWTVMTSIRIYRTYWNTEVMRESFKEVGILNSEASCRILVWHVSDATHKPLNKLTHLQLLWQNGARMAPKSWTGFLGQLVTWYDVIMVAHRIFGVSDQFRVWLWDFKSLRLEVLCQAERPPEFHHCKARGFSRRLKLIIRPCRFCKNDEWFVELVEFVRFVRFHLNSQRSLSGVQPLVRWHRSGWKFECKEIWSFCMKITGRFGVLPFPLWYELAVW